MYEEYLNIIDEKKSELCRLSDDVWDNPETAFSEKISSSILSEYLKNEGFTVETQAFGVPNAFSASYGTGKPIIGLLGEFDALAGLSQVNDIFEKKALVEGGNGHGCGHNLLGVGTIAAALAVKEYLEKSKKSGTVIYFGCPGEEGGSGKAFMARAGAFSNLDAVLTWHPGEVNAVNQGSSLANIQVLYKFYGKSAHAAANPEAGRSALDALELMNVGTNFLREHMSDDARIHYAIVNSGGFSPNVVQPFAEVLYLIRAPKVGEMLSLFERVNKVAEGMAIATETKTEYEIIKSCANVIPNTVLEEVLAESFKEIPLPEYSLEEQEYAKKITESQGSKESAFIERAIASADSDEMVEFYQKHRDDVMYNFVVPYVKKNAAKSGGGSTDVGDVSWMCPCAQISAASWAPNSGGHSWQIVAQGKGSIAHKSIIYCGKVLGNAAIKLINSNDIVENAKKEHAKRLEGQTYFAIPADVKPRPINSIGK